MNESENNLLHSLSKPLWFLLLCLAPALAFAQEEAVRLSGKEISVGEALESIERQTSFTVAFNHADLDVGRQIVLPTGTMNLKSVLGRILENTGCIYKIRKKQIVIVPVHPVSGKAVSSPIPVSSSAETGQRTYTGVVSDARDGQKLEYATVSLLDANGHPVLSGITDRSGSFRIVFAGEVRGIRIRYIGYRIFERDLAGKEPALGDFPMEQESYTLDEAVITGTAVRHKVDRTSYTVTDEMREGASNAEELLNKIHGVRFDKRSNAIKAGSESDVLLLVDGMQQSESYIRNLSPDRITRIEVITEPSGRYAGGGYSAIIHFILKETYTGYDVTFKSFTKANPAGTNGKDWLAGEQPSAGFSYTTRKINIYGTYDYGRDRWNTPVTKEVSYKNTMNNWYSEPVSVHDPNNSYKYRSHFLSGGLNYRIDPRHVFSFQGEYLNTHTGEKSFFRMRQFADPSADPSRANNTTINRTQEDDYVATLFYKGEVNDRFRLYADVSYNYYANTVDNDYMLDFLGDSWENAGRSFSRNRYRENKNLTNLNLEAVWQATGNLSFEGGYSTIWRKYDSRGIEGNRFLDYREYRNRWYLYAVFGFSRNLKMKVGTAIEQIDVRSGDNDRVECSLQPYLQLNYDASRHLNIHASYATNIYYPSLYQLSSMHTAIDTFLTQTGNPALRSAVRHTASVRFTFWNRLSLTPVFKYTPQRISEIYKREGIDFFSTFANVNVRQYILQAAYDQPLGTHFNLKCMGMFYYNEARYEGVKNAVRGWLADAEINYFDPRHELGVSLGYYRGLEKSILLQGYQMVNMDNWMFSVSKQCWDKKLSVSLSYIPPVSWGVRYDQRKEIRTPDYRESTNLDLRTYENMLFLRVAFRFNGGKVRQTGKETRLEREQRSQRTVGF